MKLETILQNEGCDARCLWHHEGALYVGWASRGAEAALWVASPESGDVLSRAATPYLVADVVVVGDSVVAALGPGDLLIWREDPRCEREAERVKGITNAPRLIISEDGELLLGTHFGEVFWGLGFFERLCGLRKDLCSLAADATQVYVGYADGACRVFARDGGKRKKVIKHGRRAVRVARGGELLFVGDARGGEILALDPATFAEQGKFAHPVEGAPYGIIDLDADGWRLVSRSYERVIVHRHDGEVLAEWTAEEGERIEDALLVEDRLYLAVGSRVGWVPVG